jgi:hypothetical protein
MNDDQTKVMSLRLPNELAAEVMALARAKGYRSQKRSGLPSTGTSPPAAPLEEDLRTLEQLSG